MLFCNKLIVKRWIWIYCSLPWHLVWSLLYDLPPVLSSNYQNLLIKYQFLRLPTFLILMLFQEYGKNACTKLLNCGHMCGGTFGETQCLPCLHGCSNDASLRQDSDDMCMICFTEALSCAPAIQVSLGNRKRLESVEKLHNVVHPANDQKS